MKWNVYYHNINKNKIEVVNIFDHHSFNRDVLKAYEEANTKEEFEKMVKASLMYYFWARCEWEITIWPWPSKYGPGIKVDVYQQVLNNWDQFIAYLISIRERG